MSDRAIAALSVFHKGTGKFRTTEMFAAELGGFEELARLNDWPIVHVKAEKILGEIEDRPRSINIPDRVFLAFEDIAVGCQWAFDEESGLIDYLFTDDRFYGSIDPNNQPIDESAHEFLIRRSLTLFELIDGEYFRPQIVESLIGR